MAVAVAVVESWELHVGWERPEDGRRFNVKKSNTTFQGRVRVCDGVLVRFFLFWGGGI